MNKSISKTSVICAVGTGLIIAVCTVLFFVKPAVENINSIGACQSYPTLSYGDMSESLISPMISIANVKIVVLSLTSTGIITQIVIDLLNTTPFESDVKTIMDWQER